MNILITGIGGPTPRSIARSLRLDESLPVNLFGTDIDPLSRGMYESDLYTETFLVPPAGHSSYWPVIERIIHEQQIDLAIVQPEREVITWAEQAASQDLPCPALLPPQALTSVLVDKARMTDILRDSGFVPPSILIDPKNIDTDEISSHLGFPFWIRSTTGSSGLGSLKVTDQEALRQWIQLNPGVSQFIGSQYLPGRNLACKLLYWNGQLVRSACAERVHYIMAKVAPSGITGNTSFGRLINSPDVVERAVAAMDILCRTTGTTPHGQFTVDLKEDEHGNPLVTEVNVRMVAFNLVFALAGANFSSDMVRLMTHDPAMDRAYRMYEFEDGLVFLRDVDTIPILLHERDLKQPESWVIGQ